MPTPADLRHSRRAVLGWLVFIIAMVFCMVVVGGVTRLTGSGLSIVEWAPIMGTLPPLSHADWLAAFAQYQQFPQYKITHPDMSLAEFQGIFFWEYMLRLLGRGIDVVFLLPFLWFRVRGAFSRRLSWQLLGALALGGMQGLVGWLMVKSGLVDEPRVSHYRLALHLGLAFSIMAYILWLVLGLRAAAVDERSPGTTTSARALLWSIAIVTVLQIVYGAFVAGLRAGLGYNTFPKMGELWIADAVMALQPWWLNLFESHATVQFVHRWLGTLLLLLVTALWLRARRADWGASRQIRIHALLLVVTVQYLLGVYTLLRLVPLTAAVVHQGCASLVLLAVIAVMQGFRQRDASGAG
ncbi:MAG: COX15/CtaA family protein [Gammaproteobacteria bacterium]|nr:COX15/CtaA family protein [Gammaproteobacteria bacterium]